MYAKIKGNPYDGAKMECVDESKWIRVAMDSDIHDIPMLDYVKHIPYPCCPCVPICVKPQKNIVELMKDPNYYFVHRKIKNNKENLN